jgi:HAD superfamily hydrolase (TIGR01509 family)
MRTHNNSKKPTANNMPQLLIFDCDGVLVDSEDLACRVIAEEISNLGFPMETVEARRLFTGGSFADVIQFTEQILGLKINFDLEARYREKTFALFEQELQPIPGISDIIPTILLQKCVASNGPLNKMTFNLKRTNLYHHFEGRLFSAYEVNRWKPDPFLFLHAAQTIGVAPEHCLVIEDSVQGVRAAVAADIPVLGFAPNYEGEALAREGARVFYNMGELPLLLDSYSD